MSADPGQYSGSYIMSIPLLTIILGQCQPTRVGPCVLSRSERSGLSRSFKERSVLSRSFFEFLATYETQKNRTFFPVLFKRTGKKVKNVPFFCKEQERTQERMRERFVLLQKNVRTFRSFSIYIYIDIYIDLYSYIYCRYLYINIY